MFEVLLALKPKLVAFTHVSNTLGTINPVEEMTRKAHEAGALVLVDGAQAVPHVPVDVAAIGCDFYVFSGHKMLGPTGSGALWGRKELLEVDAAVPGRRRHDPRGPPAPLGLERHPLEVRGGHAGHRGARSAWASRPTTSWASAWPTSASTSASSPRTRSRCSRARSPASSCTARAPSDRGGVVPFNLPGVHPHDVAQVLDRFGIAVRAGHHCTMPLHERLDLAATARASFQVYTTRADIDALVAGLKEVQALFAG